MTSKVSTDQSASGTYKYSGHQGATVPKNYLLGERYQREGEIWFIIFNIKKAEHMKMNYALSSSLL